MGLLHGDRLRADRSELAADWGIAGAAAGNFSPRTDFRVCSRIAPFPLRHRSALMQRSSRSWAIPRDFTMPAYSEAVRPVSWASRYFGRPYCCVSAFGLQGAPWTISGLFIGVGFLHFATLYAWRRQSARQDRRPQASRVVRNVLIVGAGTAGQHVAANVKGHPEAGTDCMRLPG